MAGHTSHADASGRSHIRPYSGPDVARNVTLAGGAPVTLPGIWPPRLVADLPASEHVSAAAAAAITMVCWWLVATLRRSVRQLSIERGALDAVVPRSANRLLDVAMNTLTVVLQIGLWIVVSLLLLVVVALVRQVGL